MEPCLIPDSNPDMPTPPSGAVRWLVWPKGCESKAVEMREQHWIVVRQRAAVFFGIEPGDVDGDTVENLEKGSAA